MSGSIICVCVCPCPCPSLAASCCRTFAGQKRVCCVERVFARFAFKRWTSARFRNSRTAPVFEFRRIKRKTDLRRHTVPAHGDRLYYCTCPWLMKHGRLLSFSDAEQNCGRMVFVRSSVFVTAIRLSFSKISKSAQLTFDLSEKSTATARVVITAGNFKRLPRNKAVVSVGDVVRFPICHRHGWALPWIYFVVSNEVVLVLVLMLIVFLVLRKATSSRAVLTKQFDVNCLQVSLPKGKTNVATIWLD